MVTKNKKAIILVFIAIFIVPFCRPVHIVLSDLDHKFPHQYKSLTTFEKKLTLKLIQHSINSKGIHISDKIDFIEVYQANNTLNVYFEVNSIKPQMSKVQHRQIIASSIKTWCDSELNYLMRAGVQVTINYKTKVQRVYDSNTVNCGRYKSFYKYDF